MHAPLAKFSMMRRLMSSAAWWLNSSAIDLDFQNNRAHDGIPLDPLVASTVLMLHSDGVDASTNISDSTGRHFVINSGAEIDTAQSKFGGASALFNTDVDKLILDGSSDFAFGTGDFTIDLWARPAAFTPGLELYFYSSNPSLDLAANTCVDFYVQATTNKVAFRRGATDSAQILSTTVLSVDTWYHIALTRASGQTKLFINGVQEGSTFTDSTNYTNGVNRPLIANAGYGENLEFNGWIDEFRVLKGVAAWTTTFTPPTMPYNVGVGPYDLLSCSRASIGYAQTAAGTLTAFAANQLRITDLGLLVENARTNQAVYSQSNFSSQWTPIGATATDNAAAAPDGTTTASLLTDSAGAGSHLYAESANVGSGGLTFSIFVKAAAGGFACLNASDNGATNRYAIVVNLSTGAITDTHTAGSPASPTSKVDTLGNGWFRLTISIASGGSFWIMVSLSNSGTPSWGADNTPSFTGDGTHTIYVWGAQVEAGAFASSYIPTTSGSATRAADVAPFIGNLDILASLAAGATVVDFIWAPEAGSPGTGNPRIIDGVGLYCPANNSVIRNYNGANVLDFTFADALQYNSGVKAGFAWDGSGRSLVAQGGTVVSDANLINSGASAAALTATGNNEFWYYRRLTSWTSRLADATLQALTSPTGPSPTDYAVDLNFQTGVYTVNARPQFYLSCSRASIGYGQTVAGTLVQFPANQLRITDQGLLVEDARTNSVPRSQNFSHAAWNNDDLTSITDNSGTAPDGTTTAALFLINTNNSDHGEYQNISIGSGTNTCSCYFKAGTSNFGVLCVVDASFNRYAVVVNLTSGAITDTHSLSSPSSPSAVVETLGGGWFRVSITVGGGFNYIIIGMSNSATPTWGSNNTPEYTGNGTDTILVWGAQVEVGAFASSYIPTTSAAATRASDVVAMQSALATIFGLPALSCVVDAKVVPLTSVHSFVGKSASGDNPLYASDDDQIAYSIEGGSKPINFNTVSFTGSWATGAKAGFSADATHISLAGNGGTVATNGTGWDGSATASGMSLGRSANVTHPSYFRRFTAWTERLADATLQALTSPTGPSPTDYAVDLNFQTGVYTVNARPQFYLSCSRASIGYAKTVAGTLTQFAVNQLRITDLGLLVEDARTNILVEPSEDFTTWASGVTVTDDQAVAPNGTTSMDLLDEGTGLSQHELTGSTGLFTSGDVVTASIFVKDIDRRYVNLNIRQSQSVYGYFDLLTGTVTDGGVTSGTVTFVSADIEVFGNGIYRLSVTGIMASGEGSANVLLSLSDVSTFAAGTKVFGRPFYTGTNKSIYVWGAQFEVGAFPSSYIPTPGGGVTRAADVVTAIGALSTTFTFPPHSVVVDFKSNVAPDGFWRIVGSVGVNSNLLQANSNNTEDAIYNSTAGALAATLGNSLTFTSGVKCGSSQGASTGRSVVGGGGTVATDSGVTVGISDGLLGSGNGAPPFFAYFRRLTTWTSRLADATLQGFTNP